MGATVQETAGKFYSDSSERFYEGMKRKEAEDKNSLFFNYEKRFDRIDKDKDGILSKSEITAEIERDIESYRSGIKWMCGLGIFNALFGMATQKTATKKNKALTLGLTLWCVYSAYQDKKTAEKLDRRLLQGCN